MAKRQITRKDFLKLSAAVGVTATIAACSPTAPAPTEAPKAAEPTKAAAPAAAPTKAPAAAEPTKAPAAGEPTKAPVQEAQKEAAATSKLGKFSTAMPTSFAESPMLADLVKAGKLPELAKRIPSEPMVIEPAEQGQFGGTLRVGGISADFIGWDVSLASEGQTQSFLRLTPDLAGWVPNVAKDVKVSDDKTTYTLSLRKGMKWSDGEPVTSKDFMFWYESILQDKDLSPVINPWFKTGDKVMEATAPDDQTIVIKFGRSNPTFLLGTLAHRYGLWDSCLYPAHFLKQFHGKHNPKADELAKAAKYGGWVENFKDRQNWNREANLPSIRGMIVKETSATGIKLERNPYFWQVDTKGNQLPYIDKYELERVANLEMYNAKVITGAYDFAGGQTSIMNYPAYQDGAKAGNYKVLLGSSGKGGEVFYQVNMNHADEVLQKIHQDVRFRRALSVAINREEINDLIFFGKATPRQMTVLPTSSLFKEEYATSWAQYDPALANKLLDEMGLDKKGADGIRLRSDGKPMSYQFDIVETETPKGPVTELVSEYWRKVGIDIKYKSITRQLLTPRIAANEEPMSLWHGDAVSDVLLPLDRKWITGRYGDESCIAQFWHQWYDSDGKLGKEPPDWFKSVLMDYKKYAETLDKEAAHKVLKNQADNVWSIGTVGMAPYPLVARSNLMNVAEGGYWTWDNLWTWPYFSDRKSVV